MGLASTKTVSIKRARSLGFKPSDPARDRRQAFSIARNYPEDVPAVVVKTGKVGDVFPYEIWVNERHLMDKGSTRRFKRILDRRSR